MGTTRQKNSCRNRLQNGPRSLSRMKAGTHSALLKGSHTAAHTAKQGPSLLRSQRGFVLPAKSLLFHRAFIYIHFPVLCEPSLSATVLSQTIFHPAFQLPSQTPHVCFHSRKRVHTRLSKKDRTQRLTRRNTGRFGRGRYYYHRTVSHISEALRGQGVERQTLPLLGLGRGCSRRRRGPAGLRDLFRFCRNCGLYIRRSWFSACARHGWYHYPRCALCAVEIPDGRLSKRLICRFLRSGSLH